MSAAHVTNFRRRETAVDLIVVIGVVSLSTSRSGFVYKIKALLSRHLLDIAPYIGRATSVSALRRPVGQARRRLYQRIGSHSFAGSNPYATAHNYSDERDHGGVGAAY